ncbi:MAG TPA: ribosome maturation factor RimP [Clostridiales bacterium]|nr:ribosome maturation factor RimP [Clostridiales bacterium]
MQFKSVEEIKEFLLPYAEKENVELVDVEVKLGKDPAITVFVDTEDGVDLDTLERVHNAICDPLDDLDPSFGAAYTLNVSSPGLDRPLKTDRDFEKALGLDVEVKLFAPMKGKKFLTATLVGYDGNTVTLKTDKEEFKLQLNKIAKISKAIDFE